LWDLSTLVKPRRCGLVKSIYIQTTNLHVF
jgi:hypothetical protein